jgi:chromosome segregation ATPase
MSERVLDLIDRPMMPKVMARPSRTMNSPQPTRSKSSRRERPSRNGRRNRLVTFVTPPELDLEPVEEGLAGLQRQHLKLRSEVLMQSGSLKRVEDGLELVREATDRSRKTDDRNAEEQHQLLEPLEEGLAGLQRQHLKLRAEVIAQSGSLKRVEDRLEMVCAATDRNAQEQQEILEDLKAFGSKVKAIVMVGIALLMVGLLLESTMYFHLKSVLP